MVCLLDAMVSLGRFVVTGELGFHLAGAIHTHRERKFKRGRGESGMEIENDLGAGIEYLHS